MIDVEIKEEKQSEGLDFPKLMISEGGIIVFFIAEKKGFRISGGLCCFAEDWFMYHFKDFKGEVTLRNRSNT